MALAHEDKTPDRQIVRFDIFLSAGARAAGLDDVAARRHHDL
jgi:hypothetical protein